MPEHWFEPYAPRVAVSLSRNDKLWNLIEPIWRAAQTDHTAYPILRRGLEKGLLDAIYLHYDLARYIRALQPVGAPAQSVFARPSPEMFASVICFPFAIIPAFVACLGSIFSRSSPADTLGHLQPIFGAIHIALLQHFQPMDPYTLEVLDRLWDLACDHPSALDDHVSDANRSLDGDSTYAYMQFWPHRDLAWIIYKLKRTSLLRLPRSGTSPVQKVPPEVLSCIFLHLRWTFPYFERVDDGRRNRSSHLIVRSVCRKWHGVIDQTAALWPPLVYDFGPRMAELALRLSSKELLDVKIDFQTFWDESHPLVFQHLRRIQHLDVLTESWNVAEQTALLLRASAAPEMTHFRFWSFLAFAGHLRLRLPDDIFGSTPPPKLRTVDLADCTVLLPSPLFSPALVTLRLLRCDVWFDLDDLIDTLSSLLALEVFEWHMGSDTLSRTDSPMRMEKSRFLTSTRQPVVLAHMGTLDLECPMACAAALMHSIMIPPSCTVNLSDDYTLTGVRVHDLDAQEEVLTALSASLGSHLSRVFPTSNIGYDIISVSEDPHADAQKGALLIECHRVDRDYPYCSISIFVAHEHEDRLDDEVLSFLLRGILRWPPMNVSAARFDTNHEIFSSAPLWTIILGNLPRVRHVYIDNSAESDASNSALGLGQALMNPLDIAPALTHIQLQCLSFPPSHQQCLAEAAKRRHASGSPAITLYVEECSEVGPHGGLEGVLDAHADGAVFLEMLPQCLRLGPREILVEDHIQVEAGDST
ncbi:hypothetical protein PENSPDRAFT_670664 [Peniophora sp. CONT]|nr:hypothetical protein PENSPDRAFT_670664 [Peniophora sp. CONT]